MNFLFEFKSFYKEGDIVLIKYWYDEILTPVRIIEKIGRRYKVSHNVPQSDIFNAPDEFIATKDIIDKLERI
jgi:hypothetical protein